MSASFIKSLPKAAQVWSAKAIAGIIVADGMVTNAELGVLRESIGFLESIDTINEIVNMVKSREKPKLEVLKTDRSLATKILISLVLVALVDEKLSQAEIDYFIYIAGKLGFEPGIVKKTINWGREFVALNKKKQEIIRMGEESTPVYINY
ncbi:TerB family tellurite resistance protein [bacterium]|nr:TerB family tellurite resistance protein [bacterium]